MQYTYIISPPIHTHTHHTHACTHFSLPRSVTVGCRGLQWSNRGGRGRGHLPVCPPSSAPSSCARETIALRDHLSLPSQRYVSREGSIPLGYSIIPLIKDTPPPPPIDELAICVPRDRKYAFYTVRQTLVYGNMRKITENLRRFTTKYRNSANKLVTRQWGV